MKTMDFFTKFMSAAVVVLCAAACDDNGGENPTPAQYAIAGTYHGYTLSSCDYFSNRCAGDETMVITGNEDGTVDMAFDSSTWGNFSIEKAAVTVENGVCSISGNGTTEMGMQTVQSYDCTVSGTVRSVSDATLTFDIPSVMGGLAVVFITGEAPAESLLPGTYEGYTSASCAYFQNNYTDGESLAVSAADNTLSLVFESSMGTFEVAALTVSQADGTYTVSGEGSVSMGMGASLTGYAFTLTGEVNSAKDEYVFVFTVPAVMGGLTIELRPGAAPVE